MQVRLWFIVGVDGDRESDHDPTESIQLARSSRVVDTRSPARRLPVTLAGQINPIESIWCIVNTRCPIGWLCGPYHLNSFTLFPNCLANQHSHCGRATRSLGVDRGWDRIELIECLHTQPVSNAFLCRIDCGIPKTSTGKVRSRAHLPSTAEQTGCGTILGSKQLL